jgi:hypothetical protein
MVPEAVAVAHRANGRDQSVGLAAQGAEMGRCLREIGGFVEPGVLALEHLIRADDQGTRSAPGDLLRLQRRLPP